MAGTKPGAKRGRYQPSSKRAAKRWRVFAFVRMHTLTVEECLGDSIPLRPARVPWKRLAAEHPLGWEGLRKGFARACADERIQAAWGGLCARARRFVIAYLRRLRGPGYLRTRFGQAEVAWRTCEGLRSYLHSKEAPTSISPRPVMPQPPEDDLEGLERRLYAAWRSRWFREKWGPAVAGPTRQQVKHLARIGVGAEVEVMPTREWLEYNREELEGDLRREQATWRAAHRPPRARRRRRA